MDAIGVSACGAYRIDGFTLHECRGCAIGAQQLRFRSTCTPASAFTFWPCYRAELGTIPSGELTLHLSTRRL